MLKAIYQVLPLFIIKPLARRYCEVFVIDGVEFVWPFKDVLIRKRP